MNKNNLNIALNIEPQIQQQPQPIRGSIRKRQSVAVNVVRSEVGFQFEFHCVGKYTSKVIPNLFEMTIVRNSIVPYNIENVESNTCKTHQEIKEYILLEPVENYKKHDLICKNCLSLLNFKRGSDYKTRLFDAVIMENKEKIRQIRTDKIKISSSSSSDDCVEACKQTIIPCIDEFIYLSDNFEKEILSKIDGGNSKADEIREMKNFIASMELTPEGDPNVFGIGRNEGLKNKYINLALFLIKYTRSNNDNDKQNLSGISQYLKNHILSMISLRKVFIYRVTDWLRYLIGGFYEEIFTMENLPVDENFRKNLQVDYVSEEDLIKMRLFFEGELKKRDDHIRFLEDENAKLRLQIKDLTDNLCVMSENESALTDLQEKFKQLEDDWLKQKDIIQGLSNEINRLKGLNNEYLAQIDGLRNELLAAKKEYERKMQISLDQIRTEYERKISDLNNSLNQISLKYNELEKKYNIEIRQFQIDQENLINQLNNLKKMYETDVNKLNNDIKNLNNEIMSLKNTLNAKLADISQLVKERDSLRLSEDKLKAQLNQMEMNIKNLMNQLNKITQERDDFKNQLIIITQERDNLRNQIEALKSQIAGMEQALKNYSNNISNLNNERDDLKKQLIQMTQERDNYRNNLENLKNHLNQMEIQINNLMQNLSNLTNERDEARNQVMELKSHIERLKIDLNNLNQMKINLENRINDIQGRYDDLARNYSKLQNDFNTKISIIANLEGKINELNQIIQNLQDKINMYLNQIKKYERDIEDLRKINEDQRIKLLVIPELESEIIKLKNAISACRDEWNKLSESYEILLQDIKNQISNNELLRGIVLELQGKIENHNQQIGGFDNAVRQQIEILTRQTLAKKNIDLNQNNFEAVKKTSNDMDNLKTKVVRLESQKLNKSAIFSNVGFAIDESNPKSSIAIQRNNLKLPTSDGSTMYNVKQVVMQELPNNTTTTSYYQQNSNPINNLNYGVSGINMNNNPSIFRNNYNANEYSSFNNNYSQKPATSSVNFNNGNYDKNYGANVFNNYGNYGSTYNPSIISRNNDVINVNVTSEDNEK
jgi:chromosome segregation ATPase